LDLGSKKRKQEKEKIRYRYIPRPMG